MISLDKNLEQELFGEVFKNHLKIETYSKSIENLFSIRNRRKIDYKPSYQRNYIWEATKASYFIESILLGTEIPPLIFIHTDAGVEIIDGRQRFETIQRFLDGDLKLKRKGLDSLKDLEGKSFNTLDENITTAFLDSNLRIIEFTIINESNLELPVQHKVKQEIFRRYNSGITPLKNTELENAVYDSDDVSNLFKAKIKSDTTFSNMMCYLFFKDDKKLFKIDKVMQFIRRNLVLQFLPIDYYALSRRNEIIEKLYELNRNVISLSEVFENFNDKIKIIYDIAKASNKKNIHPHINRLFFECLLWIMYISENEGESISIFQDSNVINSIISFYEENHDEFSEIDYNFNAKVKTRYYAIARMYEQLFTKSISTYKIKDSDSDIKIKSLMKNNDEFDKIDQLESLRVNKPEPSRMSVEDISRSMKRRKFLVRPSYQRSEVIDLSKASSIIESILLGITLPAIFVYKKNDGTSEVIDGQQRILTILSYIQEEYMNEDGESVKPKNHGFGLKNLKLLPENIGKKFNQLSDTEQDKILDFELFVVTIDQKINPNFDPIDLFIRLNSKPYPIKEHSFEMWNSWADREIIEEIKEETKKIKNWFYVRATNKREFRDKMENEDLFMSLVYLNFKKSITSNYNLYLDVFQKENRLNYRIRKKNEITALIEKSTSDEEYKQKTLSAIKDTKSFIKKIKLLINNENSEISIDENLKDRLDHILNPLERNNFKRTFQDFYMLWLIIEPITLEMLKRYRAEIFESVRDLVNQSKIIPENLYNGAGLTNFNQNINLFHNKFKVDTRKIRLSEAEIREMLANQKNICPISKTPLFWGDEIEIDHIIPLALGGKDIYSNLQATHKDSNRKKSCKLLD